MKASDLLVKCLENEGVHTIFGIPGEEILDVYDSFLGSSIRVVSARDERAAAFMANVSGRLTGKAGVCISTLGPGATNILTGVADANLDCAPLIAITGQVSLDRMHGESHQYIDVQSLFRPVTKRSARISRGHTIPEIVRESFKSAQTERPGSMHIEFPEDVSAESVFGEGPLFVQAPFIGESPEKKIAHAREIISQARRPVILIGNGAVRWRAHETIREFCRTVNIPAVHTFMAKGVIPDSDPLSLYTLGTKKQEPILSIMKEADVVIAVGYDFVEYAPCFWNPHRDKRIVHINVLPARVDKHYIVDAGVLGDVSVSLSKIQERVSARDGEWAIRCRKKLTDYFEAAQNKKRTWPLCPHHIIADVRSVLAHDSVVVCDVGEHKLKMATAFPCEEPNTCIISNGLASMGIGLPGGIAAKLVFPERAVVVVTGDGGFMMNSQELETAVRLNLPLVVLIWRDGGYGVIQRHQMERFGRISGSAFGNPDFVRYAESFGVSGFRVSSPEELKPILRQALCLRRPAVIDCPVLY